MNIKLLMRFPFYVLLLLLLVSCQTSRKIAYFQDIATASEQCVVKEPYITIEPHDQISIVVSSKNPELAAIVNLPRIEQIVGSQEKTVYGRMGELSGYTVSEKGKIDFPLLGETYVQGLTRSELADLLREKLREDLVKDAVITVEFLNLGFSVMGEVNKPGKYTISKDKTTLMEALSMAGDLTIYGRRDKIFLIRTNNGRTIYELDIRSADIFNSPGFYVKQNDIIYVEPNRVKANQSTVNGNNVRSVSLWISIASLLATIGVLILK